MKQPTVNILGTEYIISCETESENPALAGNSGLCEPYSKRIILDTDSSLNGVMLVENFDGYCHRVLRHEAFHALFFEAGWQKYYLDEDLIEALAVLYPKMKEIMDKLDTMEIPKK